MQLDDLGQRHGKKAVRERFAQTLLVSERQLPHVFERADVIGRDAHLVHFLPIPRYARVRPVDLADELCELNGANLGARSRFDNRLEDNLVV